IARRRHAHQQANPQAKLISLGIGDTTEPIPPAITTALESSARGLGTLAGYRGYGAEQGREDLRRAIADRFYASCGRSAQEIFVSDGSKCDIGRLQFMFGRDTTVAVQDPAYPVYVDSSVMMGMTGDWEGSGFGRVSYMRCTPDTDFFPVLESAPRADLVFFCSPNNPTGAAATRSQLERLVEFARRNGSIIVYDAAYALYISDPDCPKSIFEIPGAEEVALETCSFSKYAGFTGVRLGWTVVPQQLRFQDGTPVHADFTRVMTTVFNGASCVAQDGGLAALTGEGWTQMRELVSFYKENASILKSVFEELGFTVYGGTNAPYVWVGFPGRKSWDVFAEILEKCDIVTTPGSGFGPGGEGFVRASAFGHREEIMEAASRLRRVFKK
ncbi:class I/II aminotransferase, partial [Helicosporidium sp. ATCC 50920]